MAKTTTSKTAPTDPVPADDGGAPKVKRTRTKDTIFLARTADDGNFVPLREETATGSEFPVINFADAAAAEKYVKDQLLQGTFHVLALKRTFTSKAKQTVEIT